MYSFSGFGFVNGIFSFDQLYIGSRSRIPTLSLPPSLEEFSSCCKVIDNFVCLESFHTSISDLKCPLDPRNIFATSISYLRIRIRSTF